MEDQEEGETGIKKTCISSHSTGEKVKTKSKQAKRNKETVRK